MIPVFLRGHVTHILGGYNGGFPLSDYLKKYFRQQPKAGSRDRKMVSAAVYSYYRCAKGLQSVADASQDVVSVAEAALHLVEKHNGGQGTDIQFDKESLFPFDLAFSDGITRGEWLESMLHQPDLFIRVRRDTDKILGLLRTHNIAFRQMGPACISLPNGANVDAILQPSAYVVQDASSQKTGSYFKPVKGEKWWDTCAGAGGKSLLVADVQPGASLTVTDCRDTILYNLTDRFKKYGLPVPMSICLDMADDVEVAGRMGARRYNRIICDVPCSGSGTWARTPESLYFFDKDTKPDFHEVQTRIATNAAKYLEPGGKLYYITCSVFRQENEDVVEKVARQTGLSVTKSVLINGIGEKADSMFIAELSR